MVLDGKYVVFEPPQPAASSSVGLNRNSPNGFPRFGEEGSTRRFPAAAPMSPVGHNRKSVKVTVEALEAASRDPTMRSRAEEALKKITGE